MPTDEKIFSEEVERAFFNGPCKCCGSQDHGLMMRQTDDTGKERIALACSVPREEDWKKVLHMGLSSMRVTASFANFSCYHNNNTGQLRKAMDGFTKYGEGRHMQYMELVDFDNDAQRYSKVAIGNRFKREIRQDEGIDLEDDIYEAIPLKAPRL